MNILSKKKSRDYTRALGNYVWLVKSKIVLSIAVNIICTPAGYPRLGKYQWQQLWRPVDTRDESYEN
jgi:hypothetical protein